MPDVAAATIAFEKGVVDYFLFPPAHELARLRQLPGVVVTTRGREGFAGMVTLIPNLRLPVLSDPKVRQAMAYAIDRGVILDKATSAMAKSLPVPSRAPSDGHTIPKCHAMIATSAERTDCWTRRATLAALRGYASLSPSCMTPPSPSWRKC
jgi:ABC-type transport system substrate-binding protein